MKRDYKFIMNHTVLQRAKMYLTSIQLELIEPGKLVGEILEEKDLANFLTIDNFLELLVNTKQLQCFAETGSGGWNLQEIDLLGQIGFIADVRAYDNGHWTKPIVHPEPIPFTLMFMPGTLLKSGDSVTPDMNKILVNGKFVWDKFYEVMEEKLLPLLRYANTVCANEDKNGHISLPALGGGYFSGNYGVEVKEGLLKVLRQLLINYYGQFPCIKTIRYDGRALMPSYQRDVIGGTSLFAYASAMDNDTPSQLRGPNRRGDYNPNDKFFSIVAWDHFSYPGNDFWTMGRHSDDGVKAAATSVMSNITNRLGYYDEKDNKYKPVVSPLHTWEEVAMDSPESTYLYVKDNLIVIQ
jgi:hypothetical protein